MGSAGAAFRRGNRLFGQLTGEIMRSRSILKSLSVLRSPLAGILVLAGVGAGWFAPAASAKDIPLTAIELYDGPSGAAYVQLTDVLINGKAEMRDCTPVSVRGGGQVHLWQDGQGDAGRGRRAGARRRTA